MTTHGPDDPVRRALARWREKGLIDPALAARLREEAEGEALARGRRWGQYAVAAAGGIVVILAGGTFLGWAWPRLGEEARVFALALLGAGLEVAGARAALERSLRPVSHLLRATALGLLLTAGVYSEQAWPDATPGGIVAGVVFLSLPLLTLSLRTPGDPVLPAIRTAFAYPFLALFLERATPLEAGTYLWILDGVAVASLALLGRRILRGRASGWEMPAFTTSLFAGLVLSLLTGAVALELEEASVWPADLWLGLIVVLLLWTIRSGPAGIGPAWPARVLGWSVALGIPLLFWTGEGALDWPAWATAVLVGAWGGGFLAWGLRRDARPVVVAGCLALVVAAWYLGVEEGGSLGAVAALLFTGGLLFGVSAKLGGARSAG